VWVKGKRWKEDEVVGEIGIRQREVRREFAEGEQGTEELVRILAGVSRESRRKERRGREIIILVTDGPIEWTDKGNSGLHENWG